MTAFIDGHSGLLEVAAKSSRGDRTALVDGIDKSKTRPSVDPHRS